MVSDHNGKFLLTVLMQWDFYNFIFQQRCVIATVQDIASEPGEEASLKTANYLDACNLLFEQGLLSRRRIKILANIRKGMAFFKDWCVSHEETGNYFE